MLSSHPDNEELFELNRKEMDMENAMKGIPQRRSRTHRLDYRLISIGKKDYESYRSITEQLKFGALIPPSLNSIKSMQHKFVQNIRRMITDTIINNHDVYANTIQPNPKILCAGASSRPARLSSTVWR